MRKMKKFFIVTAAAAMILSLAGCTGAKAVSDETKVSPETETSETKEVVEEAEESEKSKPEDIVTLNVAYMPNYGSLWSVTTAKEKGYFEEEGIEINLVEFADGPTIIAAMESGSIDIGYIGHGAHKLCIAGRAKIFALSHIDNGDAVIGGPGIASAEDLRGKQVAYTAGTSSEEILKNYLQESGMTMEDIIAVNMDATAITSAMISGGVDACATWSPNSFVILKEVENTTKLCDNMAFTDKTNFLSSWIVMPQYEEKNREVVVRFTKALFKAMDYAANDNRDEAAEYVAAQTATDIETVIIQQEDAYWLTGTQVAEGAADKTVENYYLVQQNGFIETGAVEAAVPVSDYVLFDIMIEAGK